MGKNKNERERLICPVGRFFLDMEKAMGKKTNFSEHLGQACLESLKAIRALVDEKIGYLEKKGTAKGKKKMTKIKVE
jgi:hypothetical protein